MPLGLFALVQGGIGQVGHFFGGHAEIGALAYVEGQVEPYKLGFALY